jgi:CspA family cold shock protein
MIGAVRMFDRTRGFGFITSDDGPSVFFHLQNWEECGLKPKPIEGERISFDVVQSDRGPRATNFSRI